MSKQLNDISDSDTDGIKQEDKESRDRIIFGGIAVGAFLIPLFIAQAIAMSVVYYEDLLNPHAVRQSMILNMFLSVMILLFLGTNLIAKRIGSRAYWYHYPSTIAFMAVLAGGALVHMHFLGSLASMQTMLIVAVIAGFFWFIRKRHVAVFFVLTNLAIVVTLIFEMLGILPYAPFLKNGNELGKIFLDWRLVAMNGTVYLMNVSTVFAVFLYYRISLEKSRARLDMQIQQSLAYKEQLLQSQKMETIGTLAGGIAHDFNNILQVIFNNTNRSLDQLPESEPAKKNLWAVLSAGERARELVNQILTFSKAEGGKPGAVNPASVLREALKLLRSTFPSFIDIRTDIDRNCGHIWIDSSQFLQVLLNLCTNAFQAMGDKKGVLDIKLKVYDVKKQGKPIGLELSESIYIKLTVRDDGCGMDENIRARIFDPFFTTKEEGRGSGLGLSMVYGIVSESGGNITVSSTPGEGAEFNLYFPQYIKEFDTPAPMPIEVNENRKGVLLIDDDEEIVMLGKKILEKRGFNVSATTSCALALKWFREKPESFDVAIIDLTMPEMSGSELAANLRRVSPQTRIILSTGNSTRVPKDAMENKLFDRILEKPYEPDDLCQAIRENSKL